MNQIPPHALWIGSAGALQDWRRLYDLSIRAIMQLAYEETPVAPPRDFVVCRFPLNDGGGNDADVLRLAVGTLTMFLEHHLPTLVCCQAGTSRSPAIVAAALARITKQPLSAALNHLGVYHSWTIHPELFAQVQALKP